MAFGGVSVNSDLSVAGRAAVYLGALASETAVADAMHNVGALDGTVSISPNQDIVKLLRSDAQNPYAVLETSYDFQVSFAIQETDVYNLGLSLSYNVDQGYSGAVTQDVNTVNGTGNIEASAGVATPIGTGSSNTANTLKLILGADNQSPYRTMLVRIEGGNNGAGNRVVAEWQFYKVKIQATGSIDYDRTGAVTYPVTAHCLANSSDVIGRFITPNDYGRSNDYGDA